MNIAIKNMLAKYDCQTRDDYENALKEILQELALLGLWRAKFFEHAALYGATSAKLLYDADRYTESLNFSLLAPSADFKLTPYLTAIDAELSSMGFSVEVSEKSKTTQTPIESAFIKAGTKEHLIKIAVPDSLVESIGKNDALKIKIEIDTDPPAGFQTEAKTLLQPIPFSVVTYKEPDLFAGKLHAILQRAWQGRVKGRDYYDFVWYIGRGTPVRLAHLEQRLRQTGGWTKAKAMTLKDLHELLLEKFGTVDFAQAKADIRPFIKDPDSLALWSREFFESLVPRLKD